MVQEKVSGCVVFLMRKSLLRNGSPGLNQQPVVPNLEASDN